jgi:hypothetical protein
LVLLVEELYRETRASVLGSHPSAVGIEATFHIVGDPGIERAVSATQDIHGPGPSHIFAIYN